jgi:hypothetical protein
MAMNLLIYEQVENALASGRHRRVTSALLQTGGVHRPDYRTVFDGFIECCIIWGSYSFCDYTATAIWGRCGVGGPAALNK